MSRGGYFDENALMAGLVKREFDNQRSIAKHAVEIKKLGDDRYNNICTICTSVASFVPRPILLSLSMLHAEKQGGRGYIGACDLLTEGDGMYAYCFC